MENLYRWRLYLLSLVIISGALLFPGLQQALKIDNSLRSWFIDGDPALEAYYELQDHFGNDEMVILVLEEGEQNPVMESRSQIEALLADLKADSAVASVLHPFAWNLALEAEELITEGPGQNFFSEDGSATQILIKLANDPEFENRRAEIIQTIYAICDQHWPNENRAFGGLGVIYEALNELSAQDFGTFLGLGYLLMFLLIAGIYRHWTFTVYAMTTVGLSSYFTLAIYGALGFRLNLLSTLIPTIIILLGIMDVMHILNEWRRYPSDEGRLDKTLGALRKIWKPCLFTSVSTMAGFLSLSISPVAILAQFGVFAALGIALALFFSFLLGVFFLAKAPEGVQTNRSAKWLGQLQDWVVLHPKPIVAFLILSLGLAAWSIPKLQVDTDSIAYLPDDHQVRKDSRRIEELFGPYMPLDYLIKVEDQDLRAANVQAQLQDLDSVISQFENIGSMNGYHDLMGEILALSDGTKDLRSWDYSLFAPLQLENFTAENPELQAAFIDTAAQIGRFYLNGSLISAGSLKSTLAQVDSAAEAVLGPDITIQAAGYQSLYAEIVNYITESQVNSFGLAAGLVFLLLWFFLRDLKLSLISLLPNFFPVMVLLSVMVWFDIALDTATASIASIVLSFSIDDTMHFIWHYKEARRRGMDPAPARSLTMSHVGRAIVLSSIVLFAGYALMWFGSLKTVIYFGTLTATSIAAALLSQLFFFPLLLARFDS